MNIFGIPPIVIMVAGVVFVGAIMGFIFLRDRKKPLTNPATTQSLPTGQGTTGTTGQGTTGNYRAYYWDKEKGIEVIKIGKPEGSLWVADTTMPEPGGCYLVVKDNDGEFKAFDPRTNKLVEAERPQCAYDASHCKHLVNNVYASVRGLWDKINMLLPYAAAFLLFVVILVGLDKL